MSTNDKSEETTNATHTPSARDIETAETLRKCAKSCGIMAKKSPRWLDQARLKGKAEAYALAADLVLGKVDTGPAVTL